MLFVVSRGRYSSIFFAKDLLCHKLLGAAHLPPATLTPVKQGGPNIGLAVLSQTVLIDVNATLVQNGSIFLPLARRL
jgi:hypothetical protein